jgi:hypothetical protein
MGGRQRRKGKHNSWQLMTIPSLNSKNGPSNNPGGALASSSARIGTPKLLACTPKPTQILRTSMTSSIVAPSFSAPGNAVVRNQNGSPALPRWPALG